MTEPLITRWIAIGANLAVLLGLVFVGLEVRNSRAAAEAAAADGIADGFLQLNLISITDSAAARIWDQGLREPSTLSDTEAIQFAMHMRALYNQYTRVHRLYGAGLLDEADWSLYAREAAWIMLRPGAALYFEGNELPPDFIEDLEPYRGMPPNIDMRLGR